MKSRRITIPMLGFALLAAACSSANDVAVSPTPAAATAVPTAAPTPAPAPTETATLVPTAEPAPPATPTPIPIPTATVDPDRCVGTHPVPEGGSSTQRIDFDFDGQPDLVTVGFDPLAAQEVEFNPGIVRVELATGDVLDGLVPPPEYGQDFWTTRFLAFVEELSVDAIDEQVTDMDQNGIAELLLYNQTGAYWYDHVVMTAAGCDLGIVQTVDETGAVIPYRWLWVGNRYPTSTYCATRDGLPVVVEQGAVFAFPEDENAEIFLESQYRVVNELSGLTMNAIERVEFGQDQAAVDAYDSEVVIAGRCRSALVE